MYSLTAATIPGEVSGLPAAGNLLKAGRAWGLITPASLDSQPHFCESPARGFGAFAGTASGDAVISSKIVNT